jgi:hypothetical protein
MRTKFLAMIALAMGIAPFAVAGKRSDDDNPIIEMALALDPGQVCTLQPAKGLPIFDTRAAKRTLATLLPDKQVTILAIDRYGLKVRGEAINGPLTGWIGRKSALRGDAKKLKDLQAFYDRQIAIERFIGQKRPAIGMGLRDLSRIFGPATTHNIVAEGSRRTETAIWIFNEKVDLNDSLELGTNSSLLKVDVETGRVTVGLINGIANSIDVKIEGGATDIPSLPEPIKLPFELSTPGERSTSTTSR